MFVEYKKIFFLFFGPNPGSAKIEHQKKSWRMADSLSLDRQVLNKKIKWFLKKEGCLRDNLPHFWKNQKKKWRAFEKFIEKMAYFPAVFWVNKILNLYFLA